MTARGPWRSDEGPADATLWIGCDYCDRWAGASFSDATLCSWLIVFFSSSLLLLLSFVIQYIILFFFHATTVHGHHFPLSYVHS